MSDNDLPDWWLNGPKEDDRELPPVTMTLAAQQRIWDALPILGDGTYRFVGDEIAAMVKEGVIAGEQEAVDLLDGWFEDGLGDCGVSPRGGWKFAEAVPPWEKQ